MISQILNYLGHNLQVIVENGGYLFIAVTTVLEGLPVVGQFIPGQTIVIISGFLAKIDALSFSRVLPVVVVSAVLGDYIGYVLGKKYGIELLYRFGNLFYIKTEYIDKARMIIKDNSVKTILIGRFNPVTRSLTPFVVGASDINSKKFWIFDSLGAILWATLSVSAGYIFGASYHIIASLIGKYIVLATVFGILMAWGYKIINKQFHIFAKYEIITLILNILGLYLFLKTVQDALTDKMFLLQLDLHVNEFFFNNVSEPLFSIINVITNILSPAYLTFVGLICFIYFVYTKRYTYSVITALSLGGGYLSTFLIKNIVMRLRPENAFIIQGGYSFPSGHAVAATIFFTLLVYIIVIKVRSLILRELLVVVCVLSALTVAFSRVYLGVHWVSDVFAGIGLGLFWTTLSILLIRYLRLIINVIKSRRE